ncbi:hypothetical protein [Phosphitispora fastidiosa]|uniref:hypothetical protein n=1 Tax=Phosphitispora fastidiosa TaxID=2837202 RepID=UPI001E3D5486|nr:hypothetical protein [Phosphitispora fastidiosa]
MAILFYIFSINEKALATAYQKMNNWVEFSIKASVISLLLGVLFELIFLYPHRKCELRINAKIIPAIMLIIVGVIPHIYWYSLILKSSPFFKLVLNPLSVSKTQVVINVFAGILLVKSSLRRNE